jgi:hypothetical protein
LVETKILGVTHRLPYLEKVISHISAEAEKSSGKGKFRIGLESVASDYHEHEFWKPLVEALRKNPRIEIVFIDSRYGRDISRRTERTKKGLEVMLASGAKIKSKGASLNEIHKGEYVMDILRTKFFAKKIKRENLNLAVMGNDHAFSVARLLKLPYHYIGRTQYRRPRRRSSRKEFAPIVKKRKITKERRNRKTSRRK